MENENIIENNEISCQTDIVQPSPADNPITEPEEKTELTAPEETTETGETETEKTETEVTETGAEVVEVDEDVDIDYTETLLLIDEHVQLASARIEYCNCLLIIILLIILLQYVYKFFKMFF